LELFNYFKSIFKLDKTLISQLQPDKNPLPEINEESGTVRKVETFYRDNVESVFWTMIVQKRVKHAFTHFHGQTNLQETQSRGQALLSIHSAGSRRYHSPKRCLKNSIRSRAPVAHACNPRYSGGKEQEISSKPARANSS
jgi:hypothetical protein